ncbi:hypothetical protein AK830_g6359 [Neonectria ditissima]|uniref:Uncharacterized protein n=1 Tax=Neonectria ditissima TaxID=78410 RepID=A0A0P7AQP1_9HYPO|nr:hypothetical protein AK830_g6359 [Neonectria ditissima]
MEPLRPSQHSSQKSETRRERSHADIAMQNAADTMIAVTESFRHHFHPQHVALLEIPTRSYTHSRRSSSSSTSSQRLLDHGPVRQPSFSNLSWSSTPHYRTDSVQDDRFSSHTFETDAYTLMRPESGSEMAQTTINLPDDLIRLSTPNLPEPLDTPHTPISAYHAPTFTTNEQSQMGFIQPDIAQPEPIQHTSPVSDPYPVSELYSVSDSNLVPASHLSEAAVHDGGLVQAARRLDAFRANTHEYMSLRPDCGTETRPFGTVTHIRAGSEQESLVAPGVRRKPLAPPI